MIFTALRQNVNQSINQSSDIHYGACGRGSVKLTQIKSMFSVRFVGGLGGLTPPPRCLSTPKLTLTPRWFSQKSQKYIADVLPLWFTTNRLLVMFLHMWLHGELIVWTRIWPRHHVQRCSVLENHHLALAFKLLQNEDCGHLRQSTLEISSDVPSDDHRCGKYSDVGDLIQSRVLLFNCCRVDYHSSEIFSNTTILLGRHRPVVQPWDY